MRVVPVGGSNFTMARKVEEVEDFVEATSKKLCSCGQMKVE